MERVISDPGKKSHRMSVEAENKIISSNTHPMTMPEINSLPQIRAKKNFYNNTKETIRLQKD